MARTDNLTNFLTDIANAIRNKKGTQAPINASNFDAEIESIEAGSGGIEIGIEFNSVDSDGFPLIVTTKGLTKLPNCFFRNVNANNGQYIKTTRINVNSEVETIGATAFREAGNLTIVVLNCDIVPTLSNSNAFMLTPIAEGLGYIYVKDNLVENYKIATNWSTYADQIKPISELEA